MDKMMTSKKSNSTAESAHQHGQQDGVDTMEEARNVNQALQQHTASGDGVQMPRPQREEALKCPRCDSSNTKFCYYNNYNMSQPRYFCKACRRYWTQGGTLRNVPVGGARRKNKRSSSSSSASPSSSNTIARAINNKYNNNNNMPTLSALTSFPNVLPTFMSTGFEFSLPLAPPLSLSGSVAPAPALAFGGSMVTTSSFLDLLRGGVLDHEGSGGNGIERSLPPSFGFGVMQHGVMGEHHGVASIVGGSATATTQLGGQHQWVGAQHEHNKDDGNATGLDRLQQVGVYQQRNGVLTYKDNKNGSSKSGDNH